MTTLITLCYYTPNNIYDKQTSLERGRRTMRINQPMVIYTGPETYEDILAMRKSYGLDNKTKMVVIPYNELHFYKYKDVIETNRDKYWPTRDARCSTDVQIITMSKYEIIKRTLDENPFNTRYFAYIDYNLLVKNPWGSTNYTSDDVYGKIDQICEHPRDKVTMCVLGYWNPKDFDNLREFYSIYRFIVAGLFYTMEINVGKKIIDQLIDYSEYIINQGYGHSEEHPIGHIIDENEYDFNLVIGDYQDAIENYYKITSNHAYVSEILEQYKNNGHIKRLIKLLNDNSINYTINY